MAPVHFATLYPVFALAGWTILVLLWVGIKRVSAAFQGRIKPEDFAYGESGNVPPDVSLPNRNYMNLLELPVLFYVVCLVIFVTDLQTTTTLVLSWVYVALRVIHTLIHLSYNRILHRFLAFATSNVVLFSLWVVTGLGVAAKACVSG